MNKAGADGNCRGRDESDPARGVEAVLDGAAKNADETRQVGERVAEPAGHYVHSNPMDERLYAGPAALQVSIILCVLVGEKFRRRVNYGNARTETDGAARRSRSPSPSPKGRNARGKGGNMG